MCSRIVFVTALLALSLFSTTYARQPSFEKIIIDSASQYNSHNPKVFDRFFNDPFNALGSLDNDGFKLYRYAEQWKSYAIFNPGDAQGFEDAVVADINGDGWNDIS